MNNFNDTQQIYNTWIWFSKVVSKIRLSKNSCFWVKTRNFKKRDFPQKSGFLKNGGLVGARDAFWCSGRILVLGTHFGAWDANPCCQIRALRSGTGMVRVSCALYSEGKRGRLYYQLFRRMKKRPWVTSSFLRTGASYTEGIVYPKTVRNFRHAWGRAYWCVKLTS